MAHQDRSTAVSRKVTQQNPERQCRKVLWAMGVHDP